jgi:ubiquinone/menaquinone biosynthesis C-methylase UbiE
MQDKYWDKVSKNKVFTTPLEIESFSKRVNKNAQILDLGCGYGRTLKTLNNMGYKNLHGADISKEMLKRAKNEADFAKYLFVDDGIIDAKDNSFDAVLIIAVLTSNPFTKDQINMIKEVKRVLKKDGIIYINDFLINNDERNEIRYKKFLNKYNTYGVFELDEGVILRHHKEEYLMELLSDFEMVSKEKVVYKTMNGNKSNGIQYIGKL